MNESRASNEQLEIAMMRIIDSWGATDPARRVAYRWRILAKPEIGTAATNGPDMYYNPEFVCRLNNIELNLLLRHEAGHVILRHTERLRDMVNAGIKVDQRLANVAADIVDNEFMFRDFMFSSLDSKTIGGILLQTYTRNEVNATFSTYDRDNMESVYHTISKQQPPDEGGGGECGDSKGEGDKTEEQGGSNQPGDQQVESSGDFGKPGNVGGILPAPDGWSGAEMTQDEYDSLSRRQKALAQDSKIFRDNSKVWAKLISTWLTETVGQKHEHFNRPSRRQMRGGCACPSMSGGRPRKICVMIDVSGSMDETVNTVLNVLKDLKGSVNCCMDIYQVNSCVLDKKTLRLGQTQRIPDNYEVTGCGGTDFRSFFSMLEEKKRENTYDVFIAYTDGAVQHSSEWKAPCENSKCAWIIWGNASLEWLKNTVNTNFKFNPKFGKKFWAAKDQIQ